MMIKYLKAPIWGLFLCILSSLTSCPVLNASELRRDLSFQAALIMEKSIREVASEALTRGYPISEDMDPYYTGMVGYEFSPLTTTLGHIEEKRTSCNPLFASALVKKMSSLGLKDGDYVAIASSGSYPGFLLASLSACRAMGVKVLLTYSLGSSMYGGNRLGFTGLDIVLHLRKIGLLDFDLLGHSMGGDNDLDESPLFPDWRNILLKEAQRIEGYFIKEPSLNDSIKKRRELYKNAAAPSRIACFIGIGGSSITFGDSEESASFPNGLSTTPFPSMPKDGLLSSYLRDGVPVIHLLFVRGLSEEWGVPFDSDPFSWRRSWPLPLL